VPSIIMSSAAPLTADAAAASVGVVTYLLKRFLYVAGIAVHATLLRKLAHLCDMSPDLSETNHWACKLVVVTGYGCVPVRPAALEGFLVPFDGSANSR